MAKKCKCHGVSGSCSMKICWMQLAPLSHIARKLRDRYKKAERISVESASVSVTRLGNSARELSREKVMPVRSRNSLVYLVQSPDYCVTNSTLGMLEQAFLFIDEY